MDPLLLTSRELGATDTSSRDRCYPGVQPTGTLRFDAGEQVLWRGTAMLSEVRFTNELDDFDRVWQLPDLSDVTITDRRIAYVCSRWDVAAKWSSWGAPVTAALLNTAGSARAAMRRHGVVMAGQLRWEWPGTMQVLPGTPALGRKQPGRPASIKLYASAARTPGRPTLVMSGGDLTSASSAQAVGATIVRAIATHRLGRSVELGHNELEIERLTALAADGHRSTGMGEGGSRSLNLPGGLFLWFLTYAEYNCPDLDRIMNREDV